MQGVVRPSITLSVAIMSNCHPKVNMVVRSYLFNKAHDRSELIKAYQNEHIISVEPYNHNVQGIDALVKEPLNKRNFLEIIRHIEPDATTQTKAYQQQKNRERDQGRDGRGY